VIGLWNQLSKTLFPVRRSFSGTHSGGRMSHQENRTADLSGKARGIVFSAVDATAIPLLETLEHRTLYSTSLPLTAGPLEVAVPADQVPPTLMLKTPTAITAAPTAQGVQLTWQNNDPATVGYRIQRSSNGTTWTQFATISGPSVQSFLDATANNTSYLYRVQAANRYQNSKFSSAALALATPVSLSGTPVSSGISIQWTFTGNYARGFEIDRSVDGTNWTTLASNTRSLSNTYVDTSAQPGQTYDYRVVAIAGQVRSLPSLMVTQTMPGGSIQAPTNLTASVTATGTVRLGWTNNDPNQTAVEIDRSTDGGVTWAQVAQVGGSSVSFSDPTVVGDHSYVYEIRIDDGTAQSAFASPAAVTTPVAAPSGLSATGNSQSTVQVQWVDTNGTATSYLVQRSRDGSTGWATVSTQAAGAVTSFTDTNLPASTTFFYRVLAVDGSQTAAAAAVSAATQSPPVAASLSDPQYLLSPAKLASLRAAAAANSPQWVALKAVLDANLDQITTAGWEGSNLNMLIDYAMGYQILRTTDPVTAQAYADKAIGILTSATQGLVDESDTGSQVVVGVGDGQTTQFALPNGGVDASSLLVWTPSVVVQPVVRGTGTDDLANFYTQLISVSDSATGPATYVKGVDWQYDPSNLGRIEWLPGGKQPAAGATYYITEATGWETAVATGYTLVNGNALHFSTPPAVGQAVIAEYLYTDPVTGLKYQQSHNNMGGIGSIAHDDGYPARFLADVSIADDWLSDSPDFSASLRQSVSAQMVAWADWAHTNAYMSGNLESNYGAGEFALEATTAIALNNRDPADAAHLDALVQSDQADVVSMLADPTIDPQVDAAGNALGTEAGGYWGEGWAYGSLAILNIVVNEAAAAQAGIIPSTGAAADVQAWAGQVIDALIESQPTPSTVYDGGDGYTYPLAVPEKALFSVLSSVTSDPAAASYGAYMSATDPIGQDDVDWTDMVFTPTAAPVSPVNSLPVQWYSPGTGLLTARADWSYHGTFVSFQSGNLVDADHQIYAQGSLELDHGADQLLINAAALTGDQTPQDKSRYSNSVVIDDQGAGLQNYNSSQGFWYGNPGVTTRSDGTAAFAYAQSNYAAAYTNAYGGADPATTLSRDVFYLRTGASTDFTIVYDRAATSQPQYEKQLQWNLGATPTVSGDGWQVTAGASTLFGQTYSDTALTTQAQTVQVNGQPVQEVVSNPASPTSSVDYVTVLQSSPSNVTSAVASSHVQSADGQLEGVLINNTVVLFGKNGTVNGGATYTFTAGAGVSVTQYLTDMVPGKTYTIAGATQQTVTADAQGIVTFTASGTGSSQTIKLT
jgi:hypothetical protein